MWTQDRSFERANGAAARAAEGPRGGKMNILNEKRKFILSAQQISN
jgi:hypothetical protein